MKKKLSVFCSLLLALAMLAPMAVMPVFAEGDSGNTPATEKYEAPESPAVTYNLNVDWKFIKAGSGQEYPLAKASASIAKNGKQFYEIGYDDSNWLDVSVPHPINAEDSFDGSIGDAGEGGLYRGFMFYRKHVTIPAEDAGKKMFMEFEAARNSVYLYVNGELVGYYEAGIVPVGFDITDYVKPGEDNLIAVATDNASDRGQSDSSKVTHETRPGSTPGAADGYGYQWNTKDFNEVQGGLTGNVNLYVKGKVYQTLPLYNNLKTTGNYIYGSDYNIDSKSAKINVKAEIRNETTAAKNLTLQVDVVGMDGELAYTFDQDGNVDVAEDGEEKVTGMNITAKENIDNAQTIFAVYDGNKLKKAALGEKVTIANGGTKTVSVPNSIITESGTQKVYLWNSIEGMEPFDAEFAEQRGITFEHFMNMVPEDAYAAEPAATDISTVDVSYITASYNAANMRFWSDTDPYLYTVYTILKDGEDVIDVQKTVTGFRKVEYDINNGGLKINDKSTYLKGYAQRATNEWAVVGVANDWLTDIDMQLLKESNGNHIRWMHVAPKPVAVRGSDKYGVLVVCPAGDKEGDVDGRAWDQRVEAMRDAMIYFRNSPSVLFWEAGNNQITPAHMQEMTDLKAALDPNGGRFAGSRTLSSVDQIKAAEYVGTMLNRHASGAKGSMATASKYMPIMETEYARDEAPRRVWDDYSPPDYDYVNKWLGPSGSKTDGYDIWDETSEDFSVANAKAYDEFYSDRVGGSSGNNYYTGAAIMVWSDSNMHTRNAGSENCRTSGKVDPVRIPKDAFYALQAVQSDTPKVHIVGHWNYETKTANNYWYNEKAFNGTYYADTGTKAQRDPSKKTVYVIGSPDIKKVELYINNTLVKTNTKPSNTFVYAFTDIDVTQSGEVSVKAYDEMERMVAEDAIQTVGKPDHIKLTPVTGPEGLVADGSDIMYYDVAVVDEDDNVCPVNYDRLDLKVDGEGVLLGGYNSGVGDKITTNKDYCFAECGVNRVFIRSTRNAGQITLTVSHDTLGKQEATISSVAFNNKVGNNEGLSTQLQRSYAANEKPPVVEEKVEPYKTLAQAVKADFDEENGNTKVVEEVDNTDYYTVKVNNKEVTFSERPFRPSGANVVSELKPVLDALKVEGAPIVYSEPTEKPAYVTAGSLPVISITGGIKEDAKADNGDTVTQVDVANGYTTLILNQQYAENLMDWQIDVSSTGAVRTELLVPLGYLEGVSAELDAENKVYNITYSNVTPASFSLSSVEDAPFELAATVDSSQYSVERYSENYNSKDSRTDGPDGTGYLTPTATTDIFDNMGDYIASDSLIEFDFRFDSADATMAVRSSKGNWGPNLSYGTAEKVDNVFRTQTGSGTTNYQNLGAIEIGKWYHFEMEGTMGKANSYETSRLYEWGSDKTTKTLIKEVPGMNLRNLSGTSNGTAKRLEVNPGISIDNVKITSLYANEVNVTSLKDEVKANDSTQLAATALRNSKAVVIPEFEWTLYDSAGNPLNDSNITITNGILSASALAETNTVKVRATATTEGKPYGEKEISIVGADTSHDTFNAITLTAEDDVVKTGDTLNLTVAATQNGVAVTPAADDIEWRIYNEAGNRVITNSGIRVVNNVLTVSSDVVPQKIKVSASNISGLAKDSVDVEIKAGDMIYEGEEGNKDVFVSGNACEELVTGIDLQDGSWDGSGYYKLAAAYDFAGFASNTAENVIYSADMRFDSDSAGWDITNANNGRVGMQGSISGGKLKIQNGSTYFDIDKTAWYNIQIMCSTGNANAYGHMIVYKYKDGKKVHPVTEAEGEPYVAENIQMRNLSGSFNPLSPANHMKVYGGTSVDNVYCAKIVPDDLTLTVDKNTMYAGQSIQGNVTAKRKGIPFGYIGKDLIKWMVFDETNDHALGDDLITVDGTGRMAVDAMADGQTVYLRVSTLDGSLSDSKPITIQTSDIFTIDEIGFNEDYTKVVQLDVIKNFSYSKDVTFVVAVYDSTESTLKTVTTRKLPAKSIVKNEDGSATAVAMNAPMPADFDKTTDVVWVYTLTSVSENEAVTEDDTSIEATFSGNTLSFTKLPEFDAAKPVILMVLKPETTTTAVTDSDIVYIKQLTGTSLASLESINIDSTAPEGDYIIKIAGKKSGVSAINTGIVTK